MQRTTVLHGQTVYYELVRKKVKNLNLRIRRDGTVVVSCNNRVPEEVIERFLQEKADFILDGMRRMNEKAKKSVRPVEYKTGEIVAVAGKYKVIEVIDIAKVKNIPKPMVVTGTSTEKYSGDALFIVVKDPDDINERARVYENWRRKLLKEKVLFYCKKYYPMFQELGVKYPTDIRFRVMTSKWGYCRPKKGDLTFSYNLFEVPDEATEYVVVHEFAHFLEANHSERFYKQVSRVMPDWKRRRDLLSEFN